MPQHLTLQDLELSAIVGCASGPRSTEPASLGAGARTDSHPATTFDSGVYLTPLASQDVTVEPALLVHTEAPPAVELDPVTLVVYEWHNVQPGVLAWVFPSLNAAVSAARTMKNAVKWAILRGQRSVKATVDVDVERARGVVLVEAV